MMNPNRRRPGVTLPELIMATLVMGFLVLAVLSLQRYALTSSGRLWARHAVATNTIYCVKNISKAATGASIIRQPNQGESGNRLLIYFNVSPLDGASKLIEERPQGYHLYCVDDTGKKVFKYTGFFPVPLALAPLVCGLPHASANTLDLLLDATNSNMSVEAAFSRPAAGKNLVNLRWVLSSGQERIEVSESVTIEASR
jgi:hypothetical protein